MKLSKNRNSAVKRFFRNIIDYRLIKRNIAVTVAVGASVAGIALVVKYGEALDHVDAGSTAYVEVATVETEDVEATETQVTENTTEVAVVEVETSEDQVATSAFDGKFVACIDGAALNIREEANTDSTIVGKLLDGNVGDILEEDGDWVKISSGDVEGYVNSAYILTGAEAEEYAEGFKSVKGTVTAEAVRVRAEASTDAKVLDMASQGTTFTVTSQDDEWVQVALSSGSTGYISASCMEVVESYDYAMTIAAYMAMVDVDTEATTVAATTESSAELLSSTTSTATTTTTEATTATTTEAATTEAAKTTDASSYSDAYLLACLVSMEAGNESYEGQLAVACVVVNRLKSGSYGSTMYSVIYASGQFPSVTGSVMQNYLENGPTSSAQQAANAALAGTNNIGSFTRFANVKYVDTDSLSDYIIIGNHCFY